MAYFLGMGVVGLRMRLYTILLNPLNRTLSLCIMFNSSKLTNLFGA